MINLCLPHRVVCFGDMQPDEINFQCCTRKAYILTKYALAVDTKIASTCPSKHLQDFIYIFWGQCTPVSKKVCERKTFAQRQCQWPFRGLLVAFFKNRIYLQGERLTKWANYIESSKPSLSARGCFSSLLVCFKIFPFHWSLTVYTMIET